MRNGSCLQNSQDIMEFDIRLLWSRVYIILDNGSEILGYKSFNKVDGIQNKAIRINLGVQGCIPIAAIGGDIG